MCVLDLVSPPEGAPLVSAVGDLVGFVHDDLKVGPKKCTFLLILQVGN